MALEGDATQSAGRAAAAQRGGVNEADVVFGSEAEVLAMLAVLETKSLLEEGGGKGVIVVDGWFAE